MASTRAPLARVETASGASIYRIPVETFPGHINNVYLIVDSRQGGTSTLVDVGSGLPQSIEDLHGGFEALRARFGVTLRLEAVQHVVITHSHSSAESCRSRTWKTWPPSRIPSSCTSVAPRSPVAGEGPRAVPTTDPVLTLLSGKPLGTMRGWMRQARGPHRLPACRAGRTPS